MVVAQVDPPDLKLSWNKCDCGKSILWEKKNQGMLIFIHPNGPLTPVRI